MPKSKNRRKTKAKGQGSTGAQQARPQAQTIEGAAAARDEPSERAEAGAVKKKSVGPVKFFQQVRAEMQKVTWTSRGETLVSTIMVLIMVAIMSLFFFTIDQILRWVVPSLLSLELF